MTDEELIVKIRTNPDDYRQIILRYQKKLARYVYYLVGNQDEIDDVVQNVFIKAYVNLNGFNEKKKFSSWLFRIAHNEAVNHLKKNKKTLAFDEKIEIETGKNIDDELEKKELEKIINHCLDKIPLNYREILVLYYFEDLSYEEISDSLKVPLGTVAVRLSRAKKYLKKLCQKQGL